MSLDEIRDLLKICTQDNWHSVLPKLQDALLSRKKELETKIKKYRQGIKELEQSISAIKRCEICKKPVSDFKCHKCLNERQEELTELIKAIL